MSKPKVLVLGGGPDAEREVSIRSSSAIAEALRVGGKYDVELKLIDRVSREQVAAMTADVIFPYLHGPYGEGGPLQDVLEADGRPFVGTGAQGSRVAMDKLATKMIALKMGMMSPPSMVLTTRDAKPPMRPPLIVKPVHEGSTIGLYVIETVEDYANCLQAITAEQKTGVIRTYMVEPKVKGREVTVGVIDQQALPIIEIKPKDGLYDYEAKYTRNDTQYVLDPALPPGVAEKISQQTIVISKAIGVRHIARADFMLDERGTPWFLEINTTPGFTDHSLVPKAAQHRGISMSALCETLVGLALRDHDRTGQWLDAASGRGGA